MSGHAWLAVTLLAAIWPFGRDRDRDAEETIAALESRAVEIQLDGEIGSSEQKAIDSYRHFLALAADDPVLRAEAMRRIADLEIERGDADEVNELEHRAAESIALYTALLETYPRYERRDRVLYQLARAHEARGDTAASLATLDRLVAEHPQTPHLDEANFRRGEALFVEQRYPQAADAYARVLASGASTSFHEQSLYKHGWALFKQLRHREALESFITLLDRKLGTDEALDPAAVFAAMGRAEQEIVDDTLRVASIAFSYLDGAESVTEHFAASGARPYGYVIYTKLGELYLEQERYQDAAGAYRAFVDLDPWHVMAPRLQAEAVGAFERGGFADLVLAGKREFVELYGPSSPYWAERVYDEQVEVAALLKSNLNDLAAHHHANAQAQGSEDDYAAAARWYDTLLESFPDDPEAPATSFLLAEVLFESERFGDAAAAYERTAYGYPLHETSGEAGYAALLAYTRHEDTLTGNERVEWHRRGIDSALRFAATYPGHQQAAVVETDAAERLFRLGELVEARKVALGVAERAPGVEPSLQRTAWTVAAHAAFDLEAYADAERAYVALDGLVPLDDPERVELTERVASAIYRQAEQADARGDGHAAVDHFLRVGVAAPAASIRATAEYDAGAVLIRLGEWQRAAAVLEGFRSRFPEHEYAGDVAEKLAVAYVEAGDGARAAAEFERVAESAADEAVQREALWRAAELYADSGDTPRAAAVFERYVVRYPDPAQVAIEARQRLVELAAAAGDDGARLRWLGEIVAADAAAGPARTERTRLLAAEAQLALAAPLRDAFAGVRLIAPLDRSLAMKREHMERALAAYGRAADYGLEAVTTAATYEIAELYHGLGKALLDSERPPGLAADELAQYEILLEEQAFPFEEQAIEIHEVNAARTRDGVYDAAVKQSLEALAVLMPVRYAKQEIREEFVSAIR